MSREIDKGWASLDVGVALIVFILVIVWGGDKFGDYIKTRENKIIAQHTSQIGSAAKQYIKTNYNTLYDSTAGGSVTITLDDLKNSGLLPQGSSKKNSYGQDYQIKLVRNKKDNSLLDGLLITTGGTQLSFKAMDQISKDITELGGYIQNSTTATGAMGTWQMSLSDFGMTSTPGHLAVALTADVLDSINQESDRLYRFAVNGRPELNQMKTSIDMGGNNINNANVLNGTTGRITGNVTAGSANVSGNAVVNGNITAGTANVNGNAAVNGNLSVAGTGSFNGSIYTNGSIVTRGNTGWINETYGGGFYMSDNDWVRAVNNKNIYTGGQVRGGSVRSDGDMSAGGVLSQDQVNTAGAGCSVTGAISHDGTGATLSCVSGSWTKSGGAQWQTCRTCGGRWPYLLANFELHGNSGVSFNGYGPSCGGSYQNGVPNDGDYMQLCANAIP